MNKEKSHEYRDNFTTSWMCEMWEDSPPFLLLAYVAVYEKLFLNDESVCQEETGCYEWHCF